MARTQKMIREAARKCRRYAEAENTGTSASIYRCIVEETTDQGGPIWSAREDRVMARAAESVHKAVRFKQGKPGMRRSFASEGGYSRPVRNSNLRGARRARRRRRR